MTGGRSPDTSRETSDLKGFDDFELSLGDIMRGERATLGKSLLDVQRELKIKATYISAIENTDPTAFDTPGFVAGYVRSYARYLGLDPEWAFQTFCDEGNFAVAHGMSPEASGKTDKKKRKDKKKKGAGAAKPAHLRDPFTEPSVSYLPKGEALMSGIEPRAIGSIGVLFVLLAAIAYGELAKATGENAYAEKARRTFEAFVDHNLHPNPKNAKFTATRPMKGIFDSFSTVAG